MAKYIDEACQTFLQDLVEKQQAAKSYLSDGDVDETISKLFEEGLKGKKPGVSEMFIEATINGMLSGTGTPIANIASNFAQVAVQPVLTAFQAAASAVTGKNKKTLREAGAQFQALMSGWVADIPFFVKGLKTGMPSDFLPTAKTLGVSEKKFKELLVKAGVPTDVDGNVDPKAFQALLEGSYDYMTKSIPGPLGEIVRFPSRLTVAIDEYFKARLRKQALFSLASQKAQADAEKGLGDYTTLYNQYSQQAFDPKNPGRWAENAYRVFGGDDNFATAIFDVRNFAKVQTFQERLTGLPAAVQQVRTAHPLMQYVIPFLRTPWNLVKTGSTYVPGLPFILRPNTIKAASKEVIEKSKGTITEEVVKMSNEEIMARQMLGVSMMASMYGMAEAGLMTGAMPTDPRERQLWMDTGKQPFSVKIGDTWVNYGRMEPFSTALGIFADMVEAEKQIREQELENTEAAGEIMKSLYGSFISNVMQKSFVEGFAKMSEALVNPEKAPSFLDTLARPLVPAIVNQAARITDPTERVAFTTAEKLQQRIPGLREQLPAQYATYGEGPRQTNLAQAATSFAVSTPQTRVQKEMERIGASLGRPSKKLKGVELTSSQYSRLEQLIQERTRPVLEQIAPRWADTKLGKKQMEKVLEKIRTAASNQLFGELMRDPEFRSEYEKTLRERKGLQ